MNESDAEFKAKFTEIVQNVKGDAGKTSSLMKIEKRERIVRCLQNPESEPSTRFRSRVKERKYRLLQQGNEVFLGVPDESSGELIYRRAACLEEFWDIINAAHVENGHIGVVHTFAAIRQIYALLPRYLVSKYVHMCPICAHTSNLTKAPKTKKMKTSDSFTTPVGNTAVVNTPVGSTAVLNTPVGSTAVVNTPVGSTAVVNTPVVSTVEAVSTPVEGEATATTADGEDNSMSVDQALIINQTVVTDQEEETVADTTSEEPVAESEAPVVQTLSNDIRVVFTCHICDQQFDKKLFYQRHIRTHSEHKPAIPFVSAYKPPTPSRLKQEVPRSLVTPTSRGRPIIVDGDMGVEAAQGLMLAISRSDLTVVGVTCVSGIVSIENACNNALRVLKVCGREDIQVFCGAERPLVGKVTRAYDNLPGHSWQTPVDTSHIRSEHAVSAMIRLVNENPGRITLVCLGPLTNLALALRLDPQMPKKLREVFILGGNVEGHGDSSLCAEQNFHYDPESAYAVLEETPNITLLPYEVCERHKLTGDFFDSWVHLGTDKSEFLRGMGDAGWLQQHQKGGYAAVCAFALAVLADRSIALEKKAVYATVELSGNLARGMMIVDWKKRLGCESNMELVRSLDLGKIQSLLIGMVEDPEALEVYVSS